MKILKTFTKGLFTIAVLIILPIVLFTFITAKTNFFGIQSFVVLSGSMQPTLPVGSVIYTQHRTLYQKGDIIAFKRGDVNVTHRIIKINEDGTFVTQGDANNAADNKTVASSDILGRETFFLPYVGRAIVFLKTPIGFFGSVVFPITVFIILELWNLKREIEKEVERKLQKKMETAHNLSLRGPQGTEAISIEL